VDALTTLADGRAVIWVLTPKAGRDGHVEPSDIGEGGTHRRPGPDQQHFRRPGLVGHPLGGAEGRPRKTRLRDGLT